MSLKKARKQSSELLQLLEAESYGYKMDEKEKLERMELEQKQQELSSRGQ